MRPSCGIMLNLITLSSIFCPYNLARIGDQLFQQFNFNNLNLQSYPILGVEMAVGQTYPLGGFHQFRDTLGLAFHDDGTEVVDVAIAKRVAVDIKGQHRVASWHLGKGQFLFNLT